MRKLNFVALALVIVAGSLVLGACSTSSSSDSKEEFEGTWVWNASPSIITIEIDTDKMKMEEVQTGGTITLVLEMLDYDIAARTMHTRVISITDSDEYSTGDLIFIKYQIGDDGRFYMKMDDTAYPDSTDLGPFIKQ